MTYQMPKSPGRGYHPRWACPSCRHNAQFYYAEGHRHDRPEMCERCGHETVFRWMLDRSWGRGGRTWDEPRRIDALHKNHPDAWASSPDDAARKLERNGLFTHPYDESGTPVAVDYAPLDPQGPPPRGSNTAADQARRLGKKMPIGAKKKKE